MYSIYIPGTLGRLLSRASLFSLLCYVYGCCWCGCCCIAVPRISNHFLSAPVCLCVCMSWACARPSSHIQESHKHTPKQCNVMHNLFWMKIKRLCFNFEFFFLKCIYVKPRLWNILLSCGRCGLNRVYVCTCKIFALNDGGAKNLKLFRIANLCTEERQRDITYGASQYCNIAIFVILPLTKKNCQTGWKFFFYFVKF